MMEWLPAVVVAVIGFFGIWFGGRKSAQNSIKLKQAEARLEAVKEAEDVRNEVEALDRESLRIRARKWVRGPKR
jgi:hypothetical protein